MVKIKGRIVKIGNTYAFRIPKSFVDSGLVRERELVEFELSESEALKIIGQKFKDKKAFCVTESRDFNNGLAGFPESAV